MMIHTRSFALACLLLASMQAVAIRADGPPAGGILAQPSIGATPTFGQRGRSREYLDAGLDDLNAGEPKRAVQALKNSVRLAPGADNYKALGTAYAQSGDTLKAAWAYGESLRLIADPEVRSLLDSLKQQGNADDEARYRLLVARAPGEARAGDLDDAIRDYRDAYVLKPGLESAAPCLRLSADAVEGYLSSGELAKAVETLWWVDAIRRTSAGLGAEAADALARLDKAEERAVAWTGKSLQENRKSMLIDHDAWVRSMRDRASAGEPGR